MNRNRKFVSNFKLDNTRSSQQYSFSKKRSYGNLKWSRNLSPAPILPIGQSPRFTFKTAASKLVSKYHNLNKIGRYKLVKNEVKPNLQVVVKNFSPARGKSLKWQRESGRKVTFRPAEKRVRFRKKSFRRSSSFVNRFKLVRAKTITRKRSTSDHSTRYSISSDGLTLRRVSNRLNSASTDNLSFVTNRSKVRILGATFQKDGNCYKLDKRDNYTKYKVNSVLNRSLKIVSNRARKLEKRHCVAFNRYGRCARGETCKFVHDTSKVALCARYLRGTCSLVDCPFSHQISPDKMPLCAFYLRGKCFRTTCPYLHVKHSDSTPICRLFLKGHCPNGAKCDKKHQFPRNRWSAKPQSNKKVTPPKVKRKKTGRIKTKKSWNLFLVCRFDRVLVVLPIPCIPKPRVQQLPEFIPLLEVETQGDTDEDEDSSCCSDSE